MVEFAMLMVFLLVLAVGGVIADYIFPHIKPLARWIDSLPMFEDYEDDLYEEESFLFKEEAS